MVAAPRLLAVVDPGEQAAISGEIAREVDRLERLHRGLDGRVDAATLDELQRDIARMRVNLEQLDDIVAERLTLAAQRQRTTRRVPCSTQHARRDALPSRAGR